MARRCERDVTALTATSLPVATVASAPPSTEARLSLDGPLTAEARAMFDFVRVSRRPAEQVDAGSSVYVIEERGRHVAEPVVTFYAPQGHVGCCAVGIQDIVAGVA